MDMFNGDPGISWGEQCSIPLHMVNLTQCSEAPPPPSSRITAISTESTASELPTYAPLLPHPMKVEQTDRDVEVTTISSNCLSMVSLSGWVDTLEDSSFSSPIFANCPSLGFHAGL